MKLPKVTLKPANICIYCGGSERLTDEHIVPFALGGHLVLPKASCADCQKITSKFERSIARNCYHQLRAVQSYPSRRPKRLPRAVPVEFEMPHGRKWKKSVPIQQVPLPFVDVRFRPWDEAELWGGNGSLPILIATHLEDDAVIVAKHQALFDRHCPSAKKVHIASGGVKMNDYIALLGKVALGFAFEALRREGSLYSANAALAGHIASGAGPESASQLYGLFRSMPREPLQDSYFRARVFTHCVEPEEVRLHVGIQLFRRLSKFEHIIDMQGLPSVAQQHVFP